MPKWATWVTMCFASTWANQIDLLNSAVVPIYEPSLKEVNERNIKAGQLTFSTDMFASLAYCIVQCIAVGTLSE